MIIYQSPDYDTFTDEFTLDSCVSTNLLPLYCDLRDGSKLSIRGDLRTGELSVKGESPIGAAFGTHASGQFTVTSSGWTFIGTDPDSDLTANGYAWYQDNLGQAVVWHEYDSSQSEYNHVYDEAGRHYKAGLVLPALWVIITEDQFPNLQSP